LVPSGGYEPMRSLGFGLILLVALSPAVEANDLFPTCPGSVWQYVGDETGMPYVRECVGFEDVGGIRCAVMEYASDPDQGLRNFWYDSEDGVLLLRGAYRSEEQFGVIYDPGIPIISASPDLGEKLCFSVDVYALPDTTYSESWSFCHEVVDAEYVGVPAGTFFAYGVAPSFPTLAHGEYDLLGRRIGPKGPPAPMWFSAGVGEVQFSASEFYRLAAYSLPPSSLEPTTWSRLKALYGDR
jgi:hypothetical protein